MQLVVGHGNTPILTNYVQKSPGTLNFYTPMQPPPNEWGTLASSYR